MSVSGGGSASWAGNPQANIFVQLDASLELRNSRSEGSGGYGVFNHGTLTPADPQSAQANNTFKDNVLGPVGP